MASAAQYNTKSSSRQGEAPIVIVIEPGAWIARVPKMTLFLLAMNLISLFILLLAPSEVSETALFDPDDPNLFQFLFFGFMHSGTLPFLCAFVILLIAGPAVQSRMEGLTFLGLYLSCSVLAAVGYLMLAPEFSFPIPGAGGLAAAGGLLGSCAYFTLSRQLHGGRSSLSDFPIHWQALSYLMVGYALANAIFVGAGWQEDFNLALALSGAVGFLAGLILTPMMKLLQLGMTGLRFADWSAELGTRSAKKKQKPTGRRVHERPHKAVAEHAPRAKPAKPPGSSAHRDEVRPIVSSIEAGDAAEAFARFRAFLRAHPQGRLEIESHWNLARLLILKQSHNEAVFVLKMLLRAYPYGFCSAMAQNELGRLYAASPQTRSLAIEYLLASLQPPPDNLPPSLALLRRSLSPERRQEAIRLLRQLGGDVRSESAWKFMLDSAEAWSNPTLESGGQEPSIVWTGKAAGDGENPATRLQKAFGRMDDREEAGDTERLAIPTSPTVTFIPPQEAWERIPLAAKEPPAEENEDAWAPMLPSPGAPESGASSEIFGSGTSGMKPPSLWGETSDPKYSRDQSPSSESRDSNPIKMEDFAPSGPSPGFVESGQAGAHGSAEGAPAHYRADPDDRFETPLPPTPPTRRARSEKTLEGSTPLPAAPHRPAVDDRFITPPPVTASTRVHPDPRIPAPSPWESPVHPPSSRAESGTLSHSSEAGPQIRPLKPVPEAGERSVSEAWGAFFGENRSAESAGKPVAFEKAGNREAPRGTGKSASPDRSPRPYDDSAPTIQRGAPPAPQSGTASVPGAKFREFEDEFFAGTGASQTRVWSRHYASNRELTFDSKRRYSLIVAPASVVIVKAVLDVLRDYLGMGESAALHALKRRHGVLASDLPIERAVGLANRFSVHGQDVAVVEQDERLDFGEPQDALRLKFEAKGARFFTFDKAIIRDWKDLIGFGCGATAIESGGPEREVIDLYFAEPGLHLRLWRNTLMPAPPHWSGGQDGPGDFQLLGCELLSRAPHAIQSQSFLQWTQTTAGLIPVKFSNLIEYDNYTRWYVMAHYGRLKVFNAKPPGRRE